MASQQCRVDASQVRAEPAQVGLRGRGDVAADGVGLGIDEASQVEHREPAQGATDGGVVRRSGAEAEGVGEVGDVEGVAVGAVQDSR